MPSPANLRLSLHTVSVRAAAVLSAALAGVSAPAEVEAALREVLPDLIETFGLAAGALAADWYDETRAELGVRGRFRANPVPVGDRGVAALAGWASHRKITESDWAQLAGGGLQRRVADVGRETVMQASVADPQSAGWRRVTAGNGCDFCRRVAAWADSRGAVYTERSARFASHDNCGCAATPVWSGQPRAVMAYTPPRRNGADADRADRWIADNMHADAKR